MAESQEGQQTDTTEIPLWMTRYNPPGLSELVYRGGRYRRALSQMLARLPTQSNRSRDGKAGTPPLAALNTEAPNDWTVALLHGWAAVTEVLGFYQERIVNEGYLPTATERRSVLELARTVGYEMRPGVAASAALAFTVLTTKEEPSRQAAIPAGTAVQSAPAPGGRPQTFETSADFVARSEWNALRPAYVQAGLWPHYLRREATSARLVGADTGLRPGETILIVGDAPAPDGAEPPWLLATLEGVQPFPDRGYTLVTWEEPLALAGSEPLRNPQAFVVRQRAALFGYTPGGVLSRSVPDSGGGPETDWGPVTIGLPQTAVRTLIGNAEGTLFAGTGQGLYRSADQGASWQPVSVGMVQKDVHALSLDQEGRLLAGMEDGHIHLSKDGGDKWSALSGEEVVLPPRGLAKLWSRGKAPLPKTVVRSLLASARGRKRTLVAATDEGVFRSGDRGKTWQPANKDLPKTDPKTGLASVVAWDLAVTKRGKKGELYAGTDAGVFHIRKSIRLWPALAVGLAVLFSLIFVKRDLIEQITGLIRSLLPDALQEQATFLEKLPKALQGLAAMLAERLGIGVLQTGVVFGAAILAGLVVGALMVGARLLVRYLSRRETHSLGIPVRALAEGKDGHLFAGTEKGLYRSNDGAGGGILQRLGRRLARLLLGDLARRWDLIDADLTGKRVRALGVDAQEDLLVGTADGSVFRTRDNGDRWEPLGTDLSLKPIQAVWATEGTIFAAGSPPDSSVESKWSPFQVRQKLVDLDQVYAGISPDSWLVLRDGRQTPAILYQATAVEVADSRDPAKPGRFSRVVVDRSGGLDGFDRGATLARFHSESLDLLADRPLRKDVLTFDRYVPGLAAGQKLIVSGKRLRACLLSKVAEGLKLLSDDGLQSVGLDAGETYQVLSVGDGSTPETKEWRLKTRLGFVGSVTATVEQIKLEPAEDGDEIVSEVTEVQSVDAGLEQKTVVLKSPLGNCFDPTTATVYGNVVPATHGQTIEDELLGSSVGLAAHQHFLLKQRPVTYTSAATGRGLESTVKIEINGVSWQEVTSYNRLDREKRKFVLRQDDQGNTAVHFGHGAQGSGIPSGTLQVTASYRKGLGREGNVAAGSLHLLQTVPSGLKAVTNPLAATGGADPENMDTARAMAPLSVRAMARIVSLSDYEDFARQFAGIGKAQARLISRDHQQWLHITIADTAGNEVAEDSDLYNNLAAAIHSSRASHVPPVRIDSFERVFFQLKARVWIEPDRQGRMADIKETAEIALQHAFAFDRREFGQPVSAAKVITLIHGIPGVFAVELEQLYRHGQEAKWCPLLEAQGARWDAGQLRPAQMLVIKPIDGIQLDLEPAR